MKLHEGLPVLIALTSVGASCVPGDSSIYTVDVSSIISARDRPDLVYLADDLSPDLSLMFSEADATALEIDTPINPYGPVGMSPTGPVVSLEFDTGITADEFNDSFEFCFSSDIVLLENDTGREFVLAPAGTCYDSRILLDFQADFNLNE